MLFQAVVPEVTSATSAGPNSPTSAVNTGFGTAWSSPGSATTSDDLHASALLVSTSTSLLTATGFGFSIPVTATIDGIVVEIEKQAQFMSATDAGVFIVKGGVATGTDHSDGLAWPANVDLYVTHGSATDLWGESWTPADINAANFGVGVAVGAFSAFALVDHIRITVYYHECGNNAVEAGEQCDDGNVAAGDCCTPTCQYDAMGANCTDDGEGCTTDVCDTAGICTHPVVAMGEVCRVAGGECDYVEVCDGISTACPADAVVMSGVPCGTAAATDCSDPDSCDGAGSCLSNDHPDGSPCTDEPNACTADSCVAGSCAHVVDNAGATCRVAADVCDVAEVCDGMSAECPADIFAGPTTPCGSVADDTCTDPDSCDGAGTCLPNHAAATTPCADDDEICTVDECDGNGLCAHPAGNAGTECRSAAGQCDVADVCDGTTAGCPDEFAADGTDCDDASVCTSDDACSAGECVGAADDCDDGNSCTQDSCDPVDGCSNDAAPATGCLTALNSGLMLTDKDDDTKDKLLWKWVKGGAVDQAGFGDPSATQAYDFCIYSGAAALAGLRLPAGSNWAALGSKGYKYSDGSAANGAASVLLKGGEANKSKALLKGKGSNLPDPALGDLALPVIVQLRQVGGPLCLESVFDAAHVTKNDSGSFKAKAK